MQCDQCGTENSSGAKFCSQCGVPLHQVCPQCGEHLPLAAKFCMSCGQALARGISASPFLSVDAAEDTALNPPLTPRPLVAERRHLTVMFCDLVASTSLAVQLDPEDFHSVVRAYQEACGVVINRFAGSIAQYLGDGLLVYFGYPQAHEDDAQRAVRAGLNIIDAVAQLNTRLEAQWGVRLSVRVGIDTGLVVVAPVGNETRHEQMALGESLNLAARLQTIAAPDTVVISDASYRLVQGYFTCEALGAQSLKGFDDPLRVYRVVDESESRNRFDVATARGLTPFVSREQELDVLMSRWHEVQQGHGQVVVVSGEAGIGKSRLLRTFQEAIAAEPPIRLECRCSPYHQHSAFYPIIDLCHRSLRLTREDTPETKLAKLEKALSRVPLPVTETVPLFADLLNLPLPSSQFSAASPLSASSQFSAASPLSDIPILLQKQKMIAVFANIVIELATLHPVLFIVEDLHWIDPSTLELLTFVMGRVPAERILLLLTSRPPLPTSWDDCQAITHIDLPRFSQSQMDQMMQQVAGGKLLPTVVRRQLMAQTDGVPLFVEELTKMVLESGLLEESEGHYQLSGPLPPLAIPSTLQDSLMARLDRLDTAKTVAQLGAVLGRQFSHELLQAAAALDEAVLTAALDQLVEAELLYRRGLGRQAQYTFKHALIQEAAYQSLLRRTRQQYHEQIARVLETEVAEVSAAQPELVAYHYTEAGQSEQALHYWQLAGQRALERSAYMEAIAHLTRGLAVLKTLPDTPERVSQEVTFLLALGATLMTIRGFAAPEVESAYARARVLCQQMGDTPQLFPALIGLWRFYFTRAELGTTRELAEQLLRLAQQTDDTDRHLGAYNALGATLFFQGEVRTAHTYLEQGIALYDPEQHRPHTLRSGLDSGALCLSYDAWALWMLGYPDQALARSWEALELAQGLEHPFSLAWALYFSAGLHQLRREASAAQRQADELITLSTEQEFPVWLGLATIVRGWALDAQGQSEAGIAQVREGIQTFRATGAEVLRPTMLAMLAEMYGKMGRTAEGVQLLDEALDVMEKSQERWWAAELYRLQGELILQQGPDHKVEVAEASFNEALEFARREDAKSWELRVAMSLSRLWRLQGKHELAHRLLSTTYRQFTEGWDAADLIEARSLLTRLTLP